MSSKSIRVLVAAAAVAMVSTAASAQVVYTNNVETVSRFIPTSATQIAYDDVPILISTLGDRFPAIEIRKITVGMRSLAGAPSFTHNLYAFGIDNLGDPLGIPAPINLAPMVVPAAATATTFLSVLGDGTSAIATVPINYDFISNPASTFGTIAVGVSFNELGNTYGWRLTNGPAANLRQFGLFELTDPTSASNGFGYSFGAAPQPAGTFYIIVEGVGIPEPAAMGLLAPVALMLGRRRAR